MGGKVLELETDKILKQAHERGLEQGIERERFSVIKKMLKRGLSTEEIILYTGYTREDILQAKNICSRQENI